MARATRGDRTMADETIHWFAGVDWGSAKHQICLLDGAGKVVGEREFAHGGAGLAALCEWVVSMAGDPGPWDRREIGGATAVGYVRVRSLTEGGCVAWVLRLVEIGAAGEERCADVMEISRPDSLDDIADLGLTLADARLVLAGVQQEIIAAQARVHAVRRPECRSCGTTCRVKDYRQHAIATLFGQVTVRLPRFRCASCGTTEAGVAWPPYARSTPELDRLRAQFSALMPYRTAAALLEQMFPVDAGTAHETLRRYTFRVAEALP